MRAFVMVAAALGVGASIGFYAAIKLEERYILRPLNAYVDLCVKQFEEEAEKYKKELERFKIVDEKGEKDEL